MKKIIILAIPFALLTLLVQAQNDVTIGTSYQLNLQRQNPDADAFIIQNARYNSGNDLLQWETTHGSFGMRGIRFNYNSGIHFYAINSTTTALSTFTPTTRFFIGNNGNIGIGTTAPADKLHISSGNIILDNGTVPSIFTGTGSAELGRYLRITNATGLTTPAGFKAGGLLVADDFNYANPSKNDLVIKGKVGIGAAVSGTYSLMVNGPLNATGLYVNNQQYISSQWTTSGSNVYYNGPVGIGTTLSSNPNNYNLFVNGKLNTTGGLYVNDQLFVSSQWTSSSSTIFYNGTVGIGTPLSSNPNNYVLAVNGKIGAKDVHVEKTSATWPDYVFKADYSLPDLKQVESFINDNQHLQDVPAAKEIEAKGYTVGEMDAILLKKIEELTLYIIQQQKEIEALKAKIK